MAYKIVNKYGKNFIGRTFKTKKQAQKARKDYACKGIVSPKSKIVKTQRKRRSSGWLF